MKLKISDLPHRFLNKLIRFSKQYLYLIRSLFSVSLMILLGRLTGFARELLISNLAGATRKTDLAVILFNMPDMLINIILGGGLAITIIPIIQKLNKKNQIIFSTQILLIIGLIFSVVSIIILLIPQPLLSLLAPGLDFNFHEEVQGPLNLILISVPLTGLAGVTAAILNSKQKFRLGSSGTLIFNLSIISFLLLKVPLLWGISLGVLAGSILRLLIQILNIKISLNLKEITSTRLLNLKIFKKLIGNLSFATSITLLPIIARSYASYIDNGSLSLFNYSFKLINLPLQVFISSISIVFISIISKNPSNKNILNALKLTSFSVLILTILMASFSSQIVDIVFFKATFSKQQISTLYDLTFCGIFFFYPFALVNLFGTIFAALGKTKIQLNIGIILIMYMLFATPIFMNKFGINGVMISYGTSFIFASIIQFLFLINLRGRNLFLKSFK